MTSRARRSVGRPRRLDDDDERRLLLDAGFSVMRRNGYAAASLAEILSEAGLSSRALYRHFSTKDELLLAMCRRDAESVARRLRLRTESAPDSVTAVHAWVDELLDTLYEPSRASRVAVLYSEGARRAAGYGQTQGELRQLLVEPLAMVLAEGHAAGLLHSPDPKLDARTIYGVISSVWAELDRAGALAHFGRFCCPALGLRWQGDRGEQAAKHLG